MVYASTSTGSQEEDDAAHLHVAYKAIDCPLGEIIISEPCLLLNQL
jgi:hypothetical protein